MIFSDYHIHDNFSGDSVEDLENIVNQALKIGLKEIAITDHFEYDMDDLSSEWDIDLDIYVKTISELQKKYKDKIVIRIGLEVGAQPHTKDYIEGVLSKYPFDFIIISSHGINKKDIAYRKFFLGKTRREVQKLYFETVLKNVELYNNFSVYGHIDFITRYGGEEFRKLEYEDNKKIIDKILKTLISKKKGIEINTSGYRYGEERFYPSKEILKRYFELGGKILTVGSDSHRANDIAKDFDMVEKYLLDIGVKEICSFEKMEPTFKVIK